MYNSVWEGIKNITRKEKEVIALVTGGSPQYVVQINPLSLHQIPSK